MRYGLRMSRPSTGMHCPTPSDDAQIAHSGQSRISPMMSLNKQSIAMSSSLSRIFCSYGPVERQGRSWWNCSRCM